MSWLGLLRFVHGVAGFSVLGNPDSISLQTTGHKKPPVALQKLWKNLLSSDQFLASSQEYKDESVHRLQF